MLKLSKHGDCEMRRGPIGSGDPSLGVPCPACYKPFGVGDLTTLVPLGPGDDPEEQKRARSGLSYVARCVEVHWDCADVSLKKRSLPVEASLSLTKAVEKTKPAEKASILIVEDEIGPRETLRFILKPYYNLHCAATLESAMEILDERDIDLITLDLKLPGCFELSALNQVKRNRKELPVIVVTGYYGMRFCPKAFRSGAVGYLLKPFDQQTLLDLIDVALLRN